MLATAGDLLDSVRSQLDIDEARAAEVQRLLGLVSSSMRGQAGVQGARAVAGRMADQHRVSWRCREATASNQMGLDCGLTNRCCVSGDAAAAMTVPVCIRCRAPAAVAILDCQLGAAGVHAGSGAAS